MRGSSVRYARMLLGHVSMLLLGLLVAPPVAWAGDDACVILATDKVLPSINSEYYARDISISETTAMILSTGGPYLESALGYIEIYEHVAGSDWTPPYRFYAHELYGDYYGWFSPVLSSV